MCVLVKLFNSQFSVKLYCPSVTSSANKDDESSEPPKDDDPDGQKLLTTANPLSDAMKWLKPLETLTKDSVDVWVTIYDVTVRQSTFSQCTNNIIKY